MSPVKLYYFPRSGPCRGALLAAKQVGVAFDIQMVDLLKKEQFDPEFIKINPQHTVPTLVDGEFTLWDGHAIAMYLVNKYAKDDSLYPRDPKRRAVVDHRLLFDIGVLYARIRDICFPVLFRDETEVTADKIKSLEEALGWVELFLRDNLWVAGSNLTIADTAFLASITSIAAVGYKLNKFTRILDWLGRCEKEVKGWEENRYGAALFGEAVASRLKPGQFM
ncbi:glutathione S-transferase 1-1-like [Homalodisca vitripennis]|uniref:glutathione S-transferase 1-1-like n=1 Tax=Homalodisca vitripennis TaxID=197043 RepID=UPI001EEC2E14|nr:glutathione S-transferase 1-1-like [Homalodisca vitripennis]XP_046683087.1 glutathione S-transferase 1-1-like [Homalodisca vitripennis]